MSWADSTLFLRMLVAFRTFLWPSFRVSGRTWCKHVAPSTHPFHNTTEGQTRLHCRSIHSQLSQAAICSSGMWRQEMLPSILHGCHFDTISSFSVKNVVPDIFIRPRHSVKHAFQLAAPFDVSCGPTKFSNCTRFAAPNVGTVINLKFQTHVK
jgi:hypothetical protein